MKHWTTKDARDAGEITLLEEGRVLSILTDQDTGTVSFRENCDEWFSATYTSDQAIEVLEEAIEYIKSTTRAT